MYLSHILSVENETIYTRFMSYNICMICICRGVDNNHIYTSFVLWNYHNTQQDALVCVWQLCLSDQLSDPFNMFSSTITQAKLNGCYESWPAFNKHVDGLVLDCRNSSALVKELLRSCTKPSKATRQAHTKECKQCLGIFFLLFVPF